MLSTLTFAFILGVLVLVHECGHFIIAKLVKVRVEIFSIGFGKKLFGIKKGDTDYRISLVPLGGYIKMAGDNPEEDRQGRSWEFLSKPVGKRAMIVFAGPLFNYIIAFLLFTLIFIIGFPSLTAKIGEVKEGYPAETAGIIAGDRVISVDGKDVELWEDFSDLIHAKTSGENVSLRIERGEQVVTLDVRPKVEVLKNLFGEDIKVGLIGVGPADETKLISYGFGKAVQLGAQRIVALTKVTYLAFFNMVIGKISMKELAGPVSIFKISGDAAKMGFVAVLHLMAVLSINLAIINLFPIPVLDGGYLFFLLLEKIKGKPLSIKTQEIAMRIGMSLLAVLMIFVFYNDFNRVGILEKIAGFFGR